LLVLKNLNLLINNTLTGEQFIAPMVKPIIFIGRHSIDNESVDKNEDIQFIGLKSRFVSSRHAKLSYEDEAWILENVSAANIINMDESELAANKSSNLIAGNEFRLGEYSVVLTDIKQDVDEVEITVRAKFIELERDIHQRLLKWIELRRDESIDLTSVDAKEKILGFLDKILSEILNDFSPEFISGARAGSTEL